MWLRLSREKSLCWARLFRRTAIIGNIFVKLFSLGGGALNSDGGVGGGSDARTVKRERGCFPDKVGSINKQFEKCV